jgi:hypothetical protein
MIKYPDGVTNGTDKKNNIKRNGLKIPEYTPTSRLFQE